MVTHGDSVQMVTPRIRPGQSCTFLPKDLLLSPQHLVGAVVCACVGARMRITAQQHPDNVIAHTAQQHGSPMRRSRHMMQRDRSSQVKREIWIWHGTQRPWPVACKYGQAAPSRGRCTGTPHPPTPHTRDMQSMCGLVVHAAHASANNAKAAAGQSTPATHPGNTRPAGPAADPRHALAHACKPPACSPSMVHCPRLPRHTAAAHVPPGALPQRRASARPAAEGLGVGLQPPSLPTPSPPRRLCLCQSRSRSLTLHSHPPTTHHLTSLSSQTLRLACRAVPAPPGPPPPRS